MAAHRSLPRANFSKWRLLGWRPSLLYRLEAIALRFEAIPIGLEAIAILYRLEAIALRFEAIPIWLEAIAII